MAAPTTEFNELSLALAGTALDANAERLAIDSVISTGAGNELDFGSVNISGGQADSDCKAMAWQASAYGANSQVENFRFWISTEGFDIAGTVIKYGDWKLDDVTEWVQNEVPPITGEVGNLPSSEPAQNIHQGGDGTTASITSADNDTTEAIVMYVAVDATETTGVYKGTDAGFEFQFSFKYDYF